MIRVKAAPDGARQGGADAHRPAGLLGLMALGVECDDFANASPTRVIRDAADWSARGWLLWRKDECSVFAVQVNPSQEGHGYSARIANPNGKPAADVVDLGR